MIYVSPLPFSKFSAEADHVCHTQEAHSNYPPEKTSSHTQTKTGQSIEAHFYRRPNLLCATLLLLFIPDSESECRTTRRRQPPTCLSPACPPPTSEMSSQPAQSFLLRRRLRAKRAVAVGAGVPSRTPLRSAGPLQDCRGVEFGDVAGKLANVNVGGGRGYGDAGVCLQGLRHKTNANITYLLSILSTRFSPQTTRKHLSRYPPFPKPCQNLDRGHTAPSALTHPTATIPSPP